ncbi:MAG: hypothetical protein KAU20_07255 [Nanoarchaeota archaeon]|nr:hypothetical protein [Nanoarchaeota archaeon]
MLKNKKAIQLSINFIVTLIIALVVFSMGIVFFNRFFRSAEEIRETLDESTKQQMQDIMFSTSEQVIVYPSSLTIEANNNGIFGVGVLNTGGTGTFNLNKEIYKCYNANGYDMDCVDDEGNDFVELLSEISKNIKSNDQGIFEVNVYVKRNAPPGKYAISIEIKSDSAQYGEKHLVYITVP